MIEAMELSGVELGRPCEYFGLIDGDWQRGSLESSDGWMATLYIDPPKVVLSKYGDGSVIEYNLINHELHIESDSDVMAKEMESKLDIFFASEAWNKLETKLEQEGLLPK